MALALETVGHHAARDAEEPGRENTLASVGAQTGEQADEDLLGHFLDIRSVPHASGNKAVDTFEVAVIKKVEGDLLAL